MNGLSPALAALNQAGTFRAQISKTDPHAAQQLQCHRLTIAMPPDTAAAFARANGLQGDQAGALRVYAEKHTDPESGAHGVILRVARADIESKLVRQLTRSGTRLLTKFETPNVTWLPTIGPFASDEVEAKLTNTRGLFVPFVAMHERRAPRQFKDSAPRRSKRANAEAVVKQLPTSIAPATDVTAGSRDERMDAAIKAAKRNGMKLVVTAAGTFTFVPMAD